ncbi:MAG: hypothetical protein R2747_16985 [Pyrinomonadaceae bacterium]
MKKLLKVAVNDFRLVFRDNSLKFFILLPLMNLLVLRYGLPSVLGIFPVLGDYVPYIVMLITVQGAVGFGFIYSMVLVDEKDTYVAKVYGVLPISQFWFVNFRLTAPFLLATLATFLLLLADPFHKISIPANLFYSALTGLITPQMVLFVAIMAKNKIEAMTWQKLFNLPVTLPILAFFVPAKLGFLFAVLPTHWAFQGFNKLIAGEGFTLYFATGFIYSLILVGLFARRFSKVHFS